MSAVYQSNEKVRMHQDLDSIIIQTQCLTGSDALHPQNAAGYSETGQAPLHASAGKAFWVWTGYKLDELNATQNQVVDLINVLVDGKFVQDLKDP